jgi:hypothetical protein
MGRPPGHGALRRAAERLGADDVAELVRWTTGTPGVGDDGVRWSALLVRRRGPLLPRTYERADAVFGVDEPLAPQAVECLADGVGREAELLMELVKAGDGTLRLVDATFDPVAQDVVQLLPPGAVLRPLRLLSLEHSADTRTACHRPSEQSQACNSVIQHEGVVSPRVRWRPS